MHNHHASRSSSILRTFRRRMGIPGLALILLGQGAQLAEARNLIVTQNHGTPSSGGIAANTGNPTGATSASGGLTAAQAQAQAAQQVGDLTRAAHLIVTQQAVQSAAQAAAMAAPPPVPVTDGLTTLGTTNPGLTPDSGLTVSQQAVSNPSLAPGTSTTYDVPGSWTGISGVSQTTAATGGTTTVNIDQQTTTAVLNWNTFNVGKNTTVQFNQSDPGWIAFNKVAPSLAPSQILGSINAPGQIYIINANGIVFGGSCQVNVHNLTASTLPINDTLVSQGLLNNPNVDFLFSAVNSDPSYQSQLPASGIVGNIVVEPGAVLSAPTNADNVGGRIALIGPNVDNQGTILTPDGQTILAAGLQVGFLASTDPSVRGLNTSVGEVTDPSVQTVGGSGNVFNEGTISAPRGNITLTGANIAQNGVLSSTTSVAENGTIDLLAVYNDFGVVGTPSFFNYGTTGAVTFAPGSLTQILPEYSDTATIAGQIVGTSNVAVPILALPSQILVQAQTINVAGGTPDTAAEILAPNANVSLQAGTADPNGVDALQFAPDTVNSPQSIQVGAGAIIDVAGSTNVAASVADNIIGVQLLGAELADSPLQRSGPLEGQTINVDVGQTGTNADGTTWIGTPLANTLGYVNEVQYTVGELTTNGGTIAMNSGGAVTLAPGSVLDVSGGYINYAGAEVSTTHLLTSSGQIVDVSQASPDVVYSGIYTGSFATSDQNLGVTNTFSNPLESGAYYEPGYVKGGSGGSIAIQAPTMTLSGSLAGQTVVGPHQLSGSLVPAASSLLLTVGNFVEGSAVQAPGLNLFFVPDGGASPVAPTGFTTLSSVILSPDLINNDGFSHLSIQDTEGSITVEPGANILSEPRGAITLDASKITIDANIVDPGGSLNFTVNQVSAFNGFGPGGIPNQPTIDPNKGLFTLGAGDTLSTAGEVIDNRAGSASAGTTPQIISGGSVTIDSYSADLSGGTVDVSGGMIVNANGSLNFSGSSAGKIVIEAGQDPSLIYLSVLGGTLNLANTTLTGYSGVTGGSLTIKAPAVQVGGDAPGNATTLWLQPSFFSQGGFSSFTLEGIGILDQQSIPAVLIASDTQLNPAVQSWQGGFDAAGNPILTPTLLPSGLRNPVSLSFDALGVSDSFSSTPTALIRGDVVLDAGASIGTSAAPLDPLSQVSFSGDTSTILGTVYAPGGIIRVSGTTDPTVLAVSNLGVADTVDLGPNCVLSVAGTVKQVFDPYGNLIGPVLNGGSIFLTGDILAEGAGPTGPGSLLDVSGTSGTLNLPPSDSGAPYAGSIVTQRSNFVIPTLVASSGGTITMTNGVQPLVMDATLAGYAGGPSAQGGSLVISSKVQSNVPLPSNTTLIITPTETSAPVNPGISQFAASDFNGKGFDSLTLKGNVEFSGGTTTLDANASLNIASGGFLTVDSGSTANLVAPYVMLGQAFQTPTAVTPINVFTLSGTPYYLAPQSGTGVLNVTSSDLIDLGSLSLQNIDSATFTSTNDIRGDGTVDIAGTISLTAGQIYAPTATSFSIVAYDTSSAAGAVKIASNGNPRALPYSAGSTLTILATNITQDGVLNAPFGIINLGWNGTGAAPLAIDPIAGTSGTALPITTSLTLGTGSVTSVSAVDSTTGTALTIPYGVILNGVSWIDPKGNDITLTGPPAKAVNLSAINVTDSTGALVNVQGGGDLYAYQFVSGTGGSADFLAPTTATQTQTSFAILPGYQPDYAPFGAYSTDPTVAANFSTTVSDGGNGAVTQATDLGYTNASLAVGDQIYLSGNGLAAGTYTLLPARYALLPGAFLVTPIGSGPTANNTTISQPNGSNLVSGYRYDDLNPAETGQPLFSTFEVDPTALVRKTAQYNDSFANAFFTAAAIANNLVVPRLPGDSGQLIFNATASLNLMPGATVLSVPLDSTGLGGLVDIATSNDIFIYGSGQTASTAPGDLNLSVDELNSFGASSLLIGGIRQTGTSGTSVTITTANIEVDNAGDALAGPEIILVTAPTNSSSTSNLVLDPGAQITQQGTLTNSGSETLLIGNAASPGSGDGNVLWVTSNPSAQVKRSGVTTQSPAPTLNIMANALVSAVTPILDSTGQTVIDPTAVIQGQNTSLGGSQITLWLSGTMPTYTGLLLTSQQITDLSSGGGLTLSSQGSIDIYGTGTIGSTSSLNNLTLQATEILGFDNTNGTITGGDNVTFAAKTITLNGVAPTTAPGIAASGTLAFDANVIQLGSNPLEIDQYSNVALNASTNLLIQGMGSSTVGAFSTTGNLTITTPLITTGPVTASTSGTPSPTATFSATQTITAGGTLVLQAPAGVATTTTTAGLGASLALSGSSVTDNTNIQLPSGSVTMEAVTGDVQIGTTQSALVDVGGEQQIFNDLPVYTNAGAVTLISNLGNVSIAAGGTISVSANANGGNAGSLTVDAINGQFTTNGTLDGKGGAPVNGQAGQNGSFTMDVGSLAPDANNAPTLTALASSLGEFTQSFNVRVRSGNIEVAGLLQAQSVTLSADTGSITVDSSGTIDSSYDTDPNFASNPGVTTGGSIYLAASGNVTINGTLTVEGKTFNDAGKGGSITLESGTSQVVSGAVTAGAGIITIASGSTLNLGVDSNTTGSSAVGDFTGTLTLIAPQVDGSGHPIATYVSGATVPAGVGVAISSIDGTILGDPSSIAIVGNQFYQPANGTLDATTENAINTNGTAFLGAAGTTTANYTAMFNGLLGSQSTSIQSVANIEVGAEIVNPTGSLTLGSTTSNSSSDWNLANDRFGPNSAPGVLTMRAAGNITLYNSISDGFDPTSSSNLKDETLLPSSASLPANNQSWSYRLAAGSDVAAADVNQVESPATLAALNPNYNTTLNGPQGSLQLGKANSGGAITNVNTYYQVIRTGSGSIDIAAGGSVQLLNPFASIYTAGTLAPVLDNFTVPTYNGNDQTGISAQYSYAGGDVTVFAQDNIEHVTQNLHGQSIDTQLQLPVNWLDRTGTPGSATDTTSWWVDFSNFFEGIGALGGGNVSLTAGNDITNVDAVIPTNARLPSGSSNAQSPVELGGGDLLVQAGNNIDGSVFYLERGQGTLNAGNSIITNSKRLPTSQLGSPMPVTLFLGAGSFTITANGSINLGPVANPFLLPENYDNGNPFDNPNETFFSTYAPTDAINVSSLTGAVTLAESTTSNSFLDSWLSNVDFTPDVSVSEPWLTFSSDENGTTIVNYQTASMLLPSTLRVSAVSSDINIIGNLTLAPSPTGTIDLAANGSINALQPLEGSLTNASPGTWTSSVINLSDAYPAAFPSVTSPIVISDPTLNGLNNLLDETGSTLGSAQFKQSLHTPGGLHAQDTSPVRLYARTGDISGLTLFAGKQTRVIAGTDITDVSLYLQNLNANDISIIAAGRDIIPFDPNSPLQTLATAVNAQSQNYVVQAGDIQIGGPGTLEVLAGRNITLGDGLDNGDGTGLGITSIGNQRNPYLASAPGASIISGAGIGVSTALANDGLANSMVNFTNADHTGFIDTFLNPTYGGTESAIYLPDIGTALGLASGTSDPAIWSAFSALPPEQQDVLALNIFYQVLSDSGIAHNDPTSPTFGNYSTGMAAIAALFPGSAWQGSISLSSREIKTENGGSINLFAPGGDLALGSDITKPSADQGILTDEGGAINIYTSSDVNLGSSRIFTLRGGNVTIWSALGNIDAGASSKTVQAAPPTRVIVDPQTGDVQTDLAGLATGGGIGVLESKASVTPSNVNLIAPVGTVNAGDAGIRVSGNLNIAALHIVNAANISVGGASSGVPTGNSINVAGLLGASNTAGAANQAAQKLSNLGAGSDITVQVIGYGGDDSTDGASSDSPSAAPISPTPDSSADTRDISHGNKKLGSVWKKDAETTSLANR